VKIAMPKPRRMLTAVGVVITVAAAEVAVGLALIVAIFRSKKSINLDELHQMEG